MTGNIQLLKVGFLKNSFTFHLNLKNKRQLIDKKDNKNSRLLILEMNLPEDLSSLNIKTGDNSN
ncbi:hypothetical protein MUTS10_40510 [Escherichia coli]|nr:hypothetical protein MUTS9_28000 [Escherichia coli]BDY80719.1 hypothetical protein MUTS10_40510 [Escherichia coli]BDY85743.1 hypothetical protein MUTS11_40590 [Escherichia coli]